MAYLQLTHFEYDQNLVYVTWFETKTLYLIWTIEVLINYVLTRQVTSTKSLEILIDKKKEHGKVISGS